MTLSPNTLPLLFRECLRGFCAGFTIETVAWVCVRCRQPPGLLITPPSKLRVGEALVSQFKTLQEPESSSWWLSVNLLFFLLEVDCVMQESSSVFVRTLLAAMCTTPRDLETVEDLSARSGFLKIAVLPNTGCHSSVSKAWKRTPEAKDLYCHTLFQPFCKTKASFTTMLFSLQNVMAPERTVLSEGRSCRGAF